MSEASTSRLIAVQPTKRHIAHPSRAGRVFPRLAPLAFAAAIFTEFLSELWGDDNIGKIAGYNLHGADVAVMVGLLALLAARPGLGRLNVVKLLVFAIFGVAAFSLYRGMLVSPFDASFAFRPRAVTLLFLLYVTVSRRKLESISHCEPWLVLWVCLTVGLFCLRSIFGPTLFLAHDTATYVNIISLEFRSLNKDSVLLLGLAMILFLDRSHSAKNFLERKYYLSFVIITFIIVVISRQRAATVASLAGLAVLFLADYKLLGRNKLAFMLLTGSIFAVATIWITGLLPTLIDMLPAQFQVSFEKTATLTGREQAWAAALGWRFANWDIVRQLFGAPAGEPFDLITSLGVWKTSLHSQYVATLMYYGIFGAFAWASLIICGIVLAVRKLRSGKANCVGLPPQVAVAWFAALLIFGFAYEWRDGAGFFLAMALAEWAPGKASKKKVTSLKSHSIRSDQAIAMGES